MVQSHSSPNLILASASPRRLDLLRQIGIEPQVDPAAIDEGVHAKELPRDHALRLARAKAQAVAVRHARAFVLSADTVVARGRRILPKAESEPTARACLRALSGGRHRVLGAIALIDPLGRLRTRLVTSIVTFKHLSADEIDDYLAGGEWRDKAGGYAIQGRAAVFVRQLSGSYSNVVGLPLFETAALLRGSGYKWPISS